MTSCNYLINGVGTCDSDNMLPEEKRRQDEKVWRNWLTLYR